MDLDESTGLYDDPSAPDSDLEDQRTLTKTAKDMNQQLVNFLNANHYPMLENICVMIEQAGIKREQAAYGFLGFSVLFLLLAGHAAQFVCNLIGFAYPAYASVGAIRSQSKEDDTKWLIYWAVFAFLTLFDQFPSQLMEHVQIYWLLKALILLYLALPETKAAEKMFRHWVDPAILFIEIQLGKEKPIVIPPNSLRQSFSDDRKTDRDEN